MKCGICDSDCTDVDRGGTLIVARCPNCATINVQPNGEREETPSCGCFFVAIILGTLLWAVGGRIAGWW